MAWPQADELKTRALDRAISVSDAFLEKGEIASTRGRNAEETQRFNARAGAASPRGGVKGSGSARARSRRRLFLRCMPAQTEVDMLNTMKSSAPEKDKGAAEVMGRAVQPRDQAWARSEPTTKPGTASCIGSDTSIVGNIECNGPVQVFGRIEGELRASDLLISDGAQVEGNVIARLYLTHSALVPARIATIRFNETPKPIERQPATIARPPRSVRLLRVRPLAP
jgi:hypothetical protein